MTLKLALILGFIIGIAVSALCWIAEDNMGTRCLITNKNTTAICPINGEKVHFYREAK